MASLRAGVHNERTGKTICADFNWNMSPWSSGRSVLNLTGDLKPGWLGRLSSNLASHKINIVSGTAMKHAPLRWDASFEVEAKHGAPVAFKEFHPFPPAVGTTEHAVAPSIKLSDYQIEYSTRHGGSIYTEISGADCIGFLYGVLRIFSFYSLFPTELEVSTSGKSACDRFWLKGIGAAAPENDDISALKKRFSSMF